MTSVPISTCSQPQARLTGARRSAASCGFCAACRRPKAPRRRTSTPSSSRSPSLPLTATSSSPSSSMTSTWWSCAWICWPRSIPISSDGRLRSSASAASCRFSSPSARPSRGASSTGRRRHTLSCAKLRCAVAASGSTSRPIATARPCRSSASMRARTAFRSSVPTTSSERCPTPPRSRRRCTAASFRALPRSPNSSAWLPIRCTLSTSTPPRPQPSSPSLTWRSPWATWAA
mmetsp:Transcript_11743/g.27132  ORF Transcript_11743/g.27132 Transcript_11743/m.27132 type:complete len:232 (+) Transcript_11743:389-1084(+)